MASQGPLSPGTMADDATVGTVAWSNPDNAKTSNNVYAATYLLNGNQYPYNPIENSIKIVKGGTISGNEKSTGATFSWIESYISYGGVSDLWGLSWTPADINASNFGVVFSAKSPTNVISHYLKATNFGFSIPTGATINGILVEVEQKGDATDPPSPEAIAYVDNIRVTVYYTTTLVMQNSSSASTAENVTLVPHAIVVQNSLSLTTGENVSLVQHQILTVQPAISDSTIGNLVLIQYPPTTVFASQWEGIGILDSGKWTSEGGDIGHFSVDNSVHLQDNNSIKLTLTNSFANYLQKTLSVASAILGIRIGYRFSTLGTGTILSIVSNLGHTLGRLIVTVEGMLYVERALTASTFELCGTPYYVGTNNWYQVEILYTKAAGLKWKVWAASGVSLVHTEQTGGIPYYSEDAITVLAGMFSAGVITLWMDSIAVDNSAYPGPLITRVSISPSDSLSLASITGDVSLLQHHLLALDDLLSLSSIENIVILSKQVLALADVLSDSTIEAVVLTARIPGYSLAMQNAISAASAGTILLTVVNDPGVPAIYIPSTIIVQPIIHSVKVGVKFTDKRFTKGVNVGDNKVDARGN